MDRRATLTRLFGLTAAEPVAAEAAMPAMAPVLLGLEPYQGPWNFEQASHILRRCTFGPTREMILEAVELGFDGTVAKLFEDLPAPAPPVNHTSDEDANVPLGETWIDAPYSVTANLRAYRNQSLRAWTLKLMLEEGISLREKMTLFWHNHFAVSNVNDPKFLYRHVELLRNFAWGNFRELMKEITVDPTMLRFLNGNQNTRTAPNENYARELMELYTLGKGDLAGPGDYTTFTEDDVIQMAKVLTGWRDRGFNTVNPDVNVESFFTLNRHDTGSKQLSHRFNNEVITNLGDQEYAHLIDVIFKREDVALFISRKLYRWFVYYPVNEEVETNVIRPMAQILIDNDYEIRPALEALLRSAHFFDILNWGPMIKNPLDFIVSTIKTTQIPLPDDELLRYRVLYRVFLFTSLMEMEYYNPLNVAGWKAYYQEPLFYRTWINATTLQARMGYSNILTTAGYNFFGFRLRLRPLDLIATIGNPMDPNTVITEFAKLLFPMPITDSQVVALKELLLPGLPDYEWALEFGEYLGNPEDVTLANAVDAKLRALLTAMISMPEFYLS